MDHKRILFIYHHHISFYGAYKSSVSLFSNLDDYVIDIVVPKRLMRTHEVVKRKKFFDLQDEDKLKKDFRGKIRKIIHISMFRDWWCNTVSNHITKRKSVYDSITKFLSLVDLAWLKFYVFCNDYDIIHLSSTVLHIYAKLGPNIPVSMHVREEIVRSPSRKFVNSFNLLRGAVFIDYSTLGFSPPSTGVKKSVILNPFDMRNVETAKPPSLPYNAKTCITISFIGRLDAIKGYDFIINSVIKSSNKNLRLLLVGLASADAMTFIKRRSREDGRIIYFGETKEINKVYNASDYVIRGEEHLALGRTVYESVFSGIPIIVPDKGEDFSKHFLKFEEFKDIVLRYEARDEESLTSLFNGLSKIKSRKKHPRSNISEHVSCMKKFWDNL